MGRNPGWQVSTSVPGMLIHSMLLAVWTLKHVLHIKQSIVLKVLHQETCCQGYS